MPVSGNAVVKTYQAFALSETLLGKVVDAVKQGERDARRYGQVRSFEIFYHGHRSNLVIGHIYIVPAKLADSIEDFPSSLLYGAAISELTGESISDLYTFKAGDSEFDVYDKKDLAAIKEKMFTDAEGTLRSLVCFVPTWGAPRDHVVFKFTRNDEKLAMLIRHLIYGVYFDPRLSSAFELLSTDIAQVDVTDVTPKYNYPFLGENVFHQYPELTPGDEGVAKTASSPRPRIMLAKETVDDFKEELLEPGERSVLDSLTDKLLKKVQPEISTSEEVGSKAAAQHKQARPELYATVKIDASEEGDTEPVFDERTLYLECYETICFWTDQDATPTLDLGREIGYTEEYDAKDRLEYLVFYLGGPDSSVTYNDGTSIHKSEYKVTASANKSAASEPGKPQLAAKKATGDIDQSDKDTEQPADIAPVSALPSMLEAVPEAAAVLAAKKAPQPKQAMIYKAARQVVLRSGGDTLEQLGMRLWAKSASGHQEEVRVNGNRVRWTQPNRFTLAFRRSADLYVRNPRYQVVANRKLADVPQTEEAIWADKMEDLGPAPEVELPGQGGGSSETAPTESSEHKEPTAEKSKGETRLERLKQRADPEGKKTWPWEKEGAKQAAANPWQIEFKAYTRDGRNTHDVWGRLTDEGEGRKVYLALPVGETPAPDAGGYFTEESALQFRDKPETAPWKAEKAASTIGQCRVCKQAVERTTGSEVGPNLYLHRACQIKAERVARLNFIPRQVVARFYPELLKSAAFSLFHPGPVQMEFTPDLLHETVDHPEETYSPLINDVGPEASGNYVSTDPAGGIGIGRDGKPQVLDGAPLRKENDIRGYMFGDEFYSQTEGIDPTGLHAAKVLTRVSKLAADSEHKIQFKDFIKKAMGEVAATFIAAFKVTQRPLMDKIPGVGVIQLDQIEQPITLGANVQNIASRVSYLISKLNDSDIQEAINDGWAQASVWNSSEVGGFVYEVFVRPESFDQDSLALNYSFVIGTKGL